MNDPVLDAAVKGDAPADALKLKGDAVEAEATTRTQIPPPVVAPAGAVTLIEPPDVVFGVHVIPPPPPPVELMVWLGQVPVMVTFVPATRLGVDVPVPP